MPPDADAHTTPMIAIEAVVAQPTNMKAAMHKITTIRMRKLQNDKESLINLN